MSVTQFNAEPHPSETYLNEKFKLVKGMSSQTAAIVCCRLMRDQTEQGVRGHIVEIGVYEGRFFIGPALCTLPSERCIAIDTFNWPDAEVRDRFMANCKDAGVSIDRVFPESVSSAEVTPAKLREWVGGPARFVHIDGAHGYEAVSHDLRIVKPNLHVGGFICMDDVLHPQFPELTIAVSDFLKSNPDFVLFAVIDRESFAASCKFLICRKKFEEKYKEMLIKHFDKHVMKQRAAYFGREALILSAFAK